MLLLNKQPENLRNYEKEAKILGLEEKIIHLNNTVLEVKKSVDTVGWKKGRLYIISLICITKVVGPHYHVFAVFANKPRGF